MAEYKLSFTASEIDEKLKKVDSITSGISSWNELTDKPFYDEQNRVEILAETTLEFESEPFIEISPSPFVLVEGEKYFVVWNGVECECICAPDTIHGGGLPCLTDVSENAEGVTGNFLIIYGSPEITGADGGAVMFQTITSLGTYTVAIYQDTTVIKHLDNKYLEILEGEDKIEVEILPEQTITLGADNRDNPTASGFTHLALPEDGTLYSSLYSLEVGQTYTVVWEGIEYTCVAQDMSEFITSISSAAVITKVVSLGNLGYNGSEDFKDTGEPFVILLVDYAVGDTVNQMATLQAKPGITETSYDVTVYVKQVRGGYKIKPEYLPEALQFGEKQVRKDVLVETALTLFYISDYGAYGYGFNFSDGIPLFPLSLGDECIVVWDGDVYEVTVGDSSAILPNTLYIGNGSALGLSGNGEPFAIAWDSTGETGVSILSTVDMAETTHTVSIYHDTTVIKPLDPKYLPDTASGGSAKIPVFDLTAMGMEAVDINSNSSAIIETDTTEIYAALDKGAVTFSLSVTMNGETVTAICTAHSLKSMEYEQHQCVASLWLGNDLSYAAINVTKSGYIQVAALPMAQMVKEFVDAANKTATTVDLSAYESNGTIVETYSDGSTITYTMNFDDEGNPTKITDSDGNITNLTW